VRDALAHGRPVVALESTIIAHGFPYPDNLTLAHELERVVRDAGAVPAIIAIAGGRIRVGLDGALLKQLAGAANSPKGHAVAKVSRWNVGAVLARGDLGATTVAATMLCAHLAGIRVFATGGIGGVHRGATQTMDVSADLTELARTPVCVVCAGAKSILDLPLTLEYLETQGVPVLGVATDQFPAFYTPDSGLPIPTRVEDVAEAAAVTQLHWSVGGKGIVVAIPIPPGDALPSELIASATEAAIAAADRRGVQGAAWTPFVLDEIRQRTGGRSVVANAALVKHNAAVAAALARALA
jgi:pseudouridine-5'-phosphate glycosidase